MTANETYPGSISGITLNGATNDITADITTGKLGALIEMRDKQLPAMTAQPDQLVAQLRDEVNRVHHRGANPPLDPEPAPPPPAANTGPPSHPPPPPPPH